jgi:CDP-diacylglycerol pyrophosphatase
VAALVFAAEAAVTKASRGALWTVVQACLINHALTSAAFPCLDVDVSDGRERGYVIVRSPLSVSNLILAPTRPIIGVEDPSLQAFDAPNYFEDPRNSLRFLQGARQKPLARDDIVLAVNSRQSRTQDQLHVHIGCLYANAKQTVRALAPALSESRWIPLGRPFHGLEFWGRLLVQENLVGVNPFRLAAEARLSASEDRSQLTIAVAGIRPPDGRDGFVLLASYHNPLGQYSVEDFLDDSASSCH